MPGLGVVRPDAGEAVGLQLRPDRAALRSLALRLPAAEDPEEVLDVVTVLVGDDVALRERAALGAEPRPQLVEEPEVEVDELVATGSRTGPVAALAVPQPLWVAPVNSTVLTGTYVWFEAANSPFQ